MEIPYTISNRPDTGLWNAKIGIWLFLASEVMLFGGLFSAYIFLRLDAAPGLWPHGLLNVPVGTGNTVILILSSITVVLAWAMLKMRRYNAYWWWMLVTIIFGILFLVVKLTYEWPQKFDHFGAFIKPEALEKYEQYLGNQHLAEKGLPPRLEISGHLHEVKVNRADADAQEFEEVVQRRHLHLSEPEEGDKIVTVSLASAGDLYALEGVEGAWINPAQPGGERKRKPVGIQILKYYLGLDPVNSDPKNPAMDRPHFLYVPPTDTIGAIDSADIERATMFLPTHSTYFATYFTITGLHGLHVLAGVLVFIYMWLPVSKRVYQRNPEHLANRVEVCGLFWHFVDLVWIFVFPLFYLL